MAGVTGYAKVADIPEPEHGYAGCASCDAVAQALDGEGEQRGNDWHALGEWTREHAATHRRRPDGGSEER